MNFTKLITISLQGFSVFFSSIIIIKFFVYFVNITPSINFEIIDVYHSLIGSFLFLLNNFTKRFTHDFK